MTTPSTISLTRREAIGAGFLASLSISSIASSRDDDPKPKLPSPGSKPQRSLRIAHLTDIHVEPERGAEAGMAACLAHVQSLDRKPDLILTGGDHVMDVFEQKSPRATLLASIWRDGLKRECSLRVEPAIGNHDIWAWNSKKSGVPADDPHFGKAFALDMLGLSERYRSFELAVGERTWHVVVLDSIQRKGDSYIAEVDDEQWAWLEADLAATPATTPTLVLSHAPVLSVTPLTIEDTHKDNNLKLDISLIHADGYRLHKLFKSQNVKLCLSGHMHLLDRCETDGVTYICDGAVCGNWWKGLHNGVAEGYGVVDLNEDGTFEHRYMSYGWKARE